MKTKFGFWLFGFASAAVLAVAGWSLFRSAPQTAIYGIPGQYVPVTNLRPKSLDKVHLDIYSDFTCSHCQALEREGVGALKRAYGDRLVISTHYMTTSDQAVAPMVLYITAERAGRAEEVAKALMSAQLARSTDATNLEPVRAVAKQVGLLKEFDANYGNQAFTDMATAEFRAIGHKIGFFPFVMIEQQIGTTGEIGNLKTILDALFSTAPRQAHAVIDAGTSAGVM